MGTFYVGFSVEAAISLSFNSFSILTEFLEIHFFVVFRFFQQKHLDFSIEKIILKLVRGKYYLEFSVEAAVSLSFYFLF